jgi:hypothetical protein
MPAVRFDRDATTEWFAKQRWAPYLGFRSIHDLPSDAPAREIRHLEVNALLAEMSNNTLELIDFSVDVGAKNEHRLLVLNFTPSQWLLIAKGKWQIRACQSR